MESLDYAPTLVLLTFDVSFARFALRRDRIELLFEAFGR
jgi:hypothetical protein